MDETDSRKEYEKQYTGPIVSFQSTLWRAWLRFWSYF